MFHNFIAVANLALSICIIAHIREYRDYEVFELRNKLKTAEREIKDYVDSGAIKKVKISKQVCPDASGILQFVYNDVWVTPEEANRIKLEEIMP